MSKTKNNFNTAPGIIQKMLIWQRTNPLYAGIAALFLFVILGTASKYAWSNISKPEFVLPAVTVQTGEYGEIPGWWLQEHFGSSVCEVEICSYNFDADNDSLTNGQEFFYKADPLSPDSNDNGLTDGEMVAQGFDPSRPGKVTFEEVASDENVLGESLVFGQDVEEMIQSELDISRVTIELVPDNRLKIIQSPTLKDYERYAEDLNKAIQSNFPNESMAYALTAIESGNAGDLANVSSNALDLYVALMEMPVPSEAVLFHKYNIAFYKNMADLIATDAFASDPDPSNAYGDLWYDKAESMFAIIQKINFEWQRLAKL